MGRGGGGGERGGGGGGSGRERKERNMKDSAYMYVCMRWTIVGMQKNPKMKRSHLVKLISNWNYLLTRLWSTQN